MKKWNKMLLGALACISIFATGACADEGMGHEMEMSQKSRDVIANPKGTLQSRGVISLQDYVVEEREMYDWLFKNHPIFTKYGGKTVGKMDVHDRGLEWLAEGHGFDFSKASKRDDGKGYSSMMYRIPAGSSLQFPNKFIGPEKCGECHPAQYETWSRSRHATTIRFPGEHPEVNNNLTDPVFSPDTASILPKGITPDVIYATVGHLRTKFGYVDAWLLRGTYHVEGGLLRDGTGQIVAGGNQFQRTWALNLDDETVKKIKKIVPEFPGTLEEYGDNGGYVRGLASYAAKYKKSMFFQANSSYCEVCHPFKFDFKTKKEFYQKSNIEITRNINNYQVWTDNEIKNRAEQLYEKSKEIWSIPAGYKIQKLNNIEYGKEYLLNSSINVTGEKPDKLIIDSIPYPVKSWKGLLEKLCIELYNLDSDIFKELIYNPNFQTKERVILSNSISKLRQPIEISNDLYIESNLNANAILSYADIIAANFELSDEIYFVLKRK